MINRRFLLGILLTVYLCGCSANNGVNDPYEQGLTYDPSQTALIPAGPFVMGSDSWADTERPAHTVHLNAYRIDKYEVTNDQYAFYLRLIENLEDAEGNELVDIGDTDLEIGFTDNGLVVLDSTKANHPIIEVSWYGAKAYCEFIGGRLPTEAEWEKAARGETGQHFPWSNDPLESSLLIDWSLQGYGAVGVRAVDLSPYGVHDMGGNVAEWVHDWYASEYYKTSPDQNPTGPETGDRRVARGGATSPYPQDMRATVRRRYRPDTTGRSIGFRCVYDVE
ncbi:MAG: SUMF1/EgtB/PvdO family nonheme iron enzyme [Candidatus Latescibacteria bacterium]|nr:SUMF1/EgtB/PvdO family nonheme iron enzyme [Candidatus Latescibacterota bacterium]